MKSCHYYFDPHRYYDLSPVDSRRGVRFCERSLPPLWVNGILTRHVRFLRGCGVDGHRWPPCSISTAVGKCGCKVCLVQFLHFKLNLLYFKYIETFINYHDNGLNNTFDGWIWCLKDWDFNFKTCKMLVLRLVVHLIYELEWDDWCVVFGISKIIFYIIVDFILLKNFGVLVELNCEIISHNFFNDYRYVIYPSIDRITYCLSYLIDSFDEIGKYREKNYDFIYYFHIFLKLFIFLSNLSLNNDNKNEKYCKNKHRREKKIFHPNSKLVQH